MKSPVIIWQLLGVMTTLVVFHIAVPFAAYITFPALALWALKGPKQTIQTLFLLVFLTFLNPGLASSQVSALRWLVILTTVIRISVDVVLSKRPIYLEIKTLLLFGGTAILFSLFTSYAVDVSLMKAAIFATGAATILFAFRIDESPKAYWWSWLFSYFSALILLSAPLQFTSVGYFRNATGFQGITSHPQTYGALLAPFIAWLLARIIYHGERSWYLLLIFGLGSIHIILTQARTATFAIILGGLALLLSLLLNKNKKKRTIAVRTFLKPWTLILAPLLFIAIILSWSSIKSSGLEFITKGRGNDPTMEAMEIAQNIPSSREALIESSWANFIEHPLFGIGFGVGSNPYTFFIQRIEPFGIPIGASIEKGFLPTALLEEVGIFGAFIFFILLYKLIQPIRRSDDLSAEWMFYAMLFTNFGEM